MPEAKITALGFNKGFNPSFQLFSDLNPTFNYQNTILVWLSFFYMGFYKIGKAQKDGHNWNFELLMSRRCKKKS